MPQLPYTPGFDISDLITIVVLIGLAGAALFNARRNIRLQRCLEHETGRADAAELRAGSLRQAQDPGTEIQNRLAFVVESRMPDGPPQQRRAAAQVWAGQMIEDVRGARLLLVEDGEADDT